MPHRSRRPLVVAFAGLLSASLAWPRPAAEAQTAASVAAPAEAPKLIVFITVDQFRGDYLERYRPDLHYGLAKLMNGAWFTNAFQDHAITETAPGHASTMSGRFPASTGITSNSAGVVDRNYTLLTGLPGEIGASPERFVGTTLFDWVKAKDSRSRALSVSMKDRAAILPIGRAKQDVYWYSSNGSFTTSDYYRDTLPGWVTQFNARRSMQKYAGASWTLSRDSSLYKEPDFVPYENGGRDIVFPHVFPSDTARAMVYVRTTPTMDSLTAHFALEGLRQTGIGLGPQTDILAVSFSATDYIGHAFGPDSREAHENQIRLDQTLGRFIDSLYKLRDSSTIMFALTGDHGMSPIPELARDRGQATGNEGLRVTIRPEVDSIRKALRAAGVDTMAFYNDVETIAVDHVALSAAHLNADSVIDVFMRLARAVPGVARVDRMADVRRANFDRDPIARRWAHQIPKGSPVDLVITLTRYSYWNNSVATHGSPYDQDAWVPIIFFGPWIKPGKYGGFTRTVDIAPTLAAIARVPPLEALDGVVLKQVIR